MKQLTILLSAALFISCNDTTDDPLCACHEVQLQAAKEYQAANGDTEKLEAIQEKYKEEVEQCQKVVSELSEEMKDLSKEEKKKKEQEHANNCPAFKELQELKSKK
ncbi:hypothetical protein [Parvicella tangerina]|uniref:Lipoprotein n=1 Tax=Parvicella tangerina TaxID=2829795 RepID=A0A916NBU6_9FLAO|nr:hypothetical protein [Parvicella tangerina]CAG5081681.1 hypothetical protein CRYO30217_01701 [Parvicella tangerina]